MARPPSLPLESLCAAWLAGAAEADRLAAEKDALEGQAAAGTASTAAPLQDRLKALETALAARDAAMADSLASMAKTPATTASQAVAKLTVVIALFEHEEGLEHRFMVASAREALTMLSGP